jgi:hypothetical protein
MEFLRGVRTACDSCRRQPGMRAVIEQFQMRQVRWWVVNGVVVVPIWIVEHLRMHPELWIAADSGSSVAAPAKVAGSSCH